MSQFAPENRVVCPDEAERNIVPTALEIQDEQSEVTIGARPTLPKQLRDDQVIRVELRGSGETVLWNTELAVHQVREQLNGSAGLVAFILPTASLGTGMHTLNFLDGRAVPMHRATVEITRVHSAPASGGA